MQITITSLKKDNHILNISATDNIYAVKTMLGNIISVNPDNIKLIYSGKILADTNLVSSCDIVENSKIIYMAKKVAPPIAPAKPQENLFELAEKQAKNSSKYKAKLMPVIYNAMLSSLDTNKDIIFNEIKTNPEVTTFLSNNPETKETLRNFMESKTFIPEVLKYGGTSSFINNNAHDMINNLFNSNQSMDQELENMLNALGNQNMGQGFENIFDGLENQESHDIPSSDAELTTEEINDVTELSKLGVSMEVAKAYYIMCGKDKNLAANYIFEQD